MNRRSGATLIEVLVAIFVMGIGLLALLALFPVGILTMAQAIQDDRAAHCVANATAIAQALNIRQDVSLVPATGLSMYDNPNPTPASGEFTLVTAGPDQSSYPVYVDPIGYRSYLSPYSQWVGGQTNGVARSNVSFVNSIPTSIKWFTLLDDLTFADDGTPSLASGNVEREGRFSWAYLVRRPRNAERSVVNLSVIVYMQRSLAMNNNLQPDEAAYTASFDTARNVVTLSWTTQQPPNLRVGSWIFDTTPVVVNSGPPATYGPPHAAFYRVVGVTELSTTSTEVEVQTPLRDFATTPYNGTVVVMDNIIEVFEKGSGWRP